MTKTQDKLFFDKASAAAESAVVSIGQEGGMTLEISGDATAVSVAVLGQVYSPTDGATGAWTPLAAVSQTNFDVADGTITKAGIYSVNVSGLTKVKLNLTAVTGGTVTAYGVLGV